MGFASLTNIFELYRYDSLFLSRLERKHVFGHQFHCSLFILVLYYVNKRICSAFSSLNTLLIHILAK
jgi:hypothetical protein